MCQHWQGPGVNSLPCPHSLLLSPNLHFLLQVCVLSNSCQPIFFPSTELFSFHLPHKLQARRHFWDYITFSRGTTTQAFEELGFSRALAAFISQELLLTLGDVHWSWHPLKENALKKTGGPSSVPLRRRVDIPLMPLTHFLCFSPDKMWFDASFFPFKQRWSRMHTFFFFLVLLSWYFLMVLWFSNPL